MLQNELYRSVISVDEFCCFVLDYELGPGVSSSPQSPQKEKKRANYYRLVEKALQFRVPLALNAVTTNNKACRNIFGINSRTFNFLYTCTPVDFMF